MGTQVPTVDQAVAQIAGGQHGVVTRSELLRAGLTVTQIARRVRRGGLISQFRGVYRVGHAAPSVAARYMAAVLAAGNGAVVSGNAAAHLFGLIKGVPPAPEVTTTSDCRIPDLTVRRTRFLDWRDVTTFRGIPITTVPRTLVDLAAVLAEDELARVCHEAWIRYRVRPGQIDAVVLRHPRTPGAPKLRRVIHGDVHVTLSKLEKRFLRILREGGLPLPITNKIIDAHLIDCRWPDYRLTVELDSYRFHNTRYSWEQGYERERAAHARRDRFRRYTWRDVFEDPSRMLAELRELLAGQPAARR